MRRRKRLVQIDVHRIDAQITRPHLADDGVEVGAVAIEVSAGLVHDARDFHDLGFEETARVGIGQHDGGDVGTDCGPHRIGRHRAICLRGYGAHGVAHERRRRRIGAVRRIRHQHDAALGALRLVRGLDGEHAGQLAVRASLGAERHRRHAGELHQIARQHFHQRDCALHGLLGLQRMDVAKARQPRHLLVQARIVLHRARAQRIEPAVDRVILARQPHVVAHRLGLGEAGQSDSASPLEATEAGGD